MSQKRNQHTNSDVYGHYNKIRNKATISDFHLSTASKPIERNPISEFWDSTNLVLSCPREPDLIFIQGKRRYKSDKAHLHTRVA
jgi:hypothetical protein